MIQYLGVVIDSIAMKVTLTPERKESLLRGCKKLKSCLNISVLDVAKDSGMILASFPAVQFGPLHSRKLEGDKTSALKASKGNCDYDIQLSHRGKLELTGWIDTIQTAGNDVCCSDPDIVISSDISLSDWGCECEVVSSGGCG